MIRFNKVSKVYPDSSVALDSIDFGVGREEFITIVGHSGAGKTTLLKMLLREERPTDGEILFEDIDITKLKNSLVPGYRRRIGAIFQDFKLLPAKNAFENVAFAMEAAGRLSKEIEENVPFVLDLVGLTDKNSRFPDELSGGERQKVAIARAIINRPDLVVADEPTGNLDPASTREVITIFEKINKLGTTIILATHNKEVVDSLGRRVVTMEKGKIIRDDKSGRYNVLT